MTRKQIDAAREIRLWTGQIVVPAVIAVLALSPDIRAKIKSKALNVKDHIKTVFKK